MFAGPNGSGKSTIKQLVSPALISAYVNADEFEKQALESGYIDLACFDLVPDEQDMKAFLVSHPLIVRSGLVDSIPQLNMEGSRVDFRKVRINSYMASAVADFLRHALIAQRRSFTFETVMSSESKVEFLRKAQASGYRTYLYFVATESPALNLKRVANRVEEGGHDVPADKITSRYYRSLQLLPAAIASSNRAYVFDNSGNRAVLLAEVTDGVELQYHTGEVPDWFFSAYADLVQDDTAC